MIDVHNSDMVVARLGQPSLDAIGQAVAETRDDLREYRHGLPRLAARHTQRGLLNWIHDQLFANLVNRFEGAAVPGLHVRDAEPTREIYVGPPSEYFRLRFKKHDAHDLIASYPTLGFRDFASQDVQTTVQEIRLTGGFRWDAVTETIGAAVISARDGSENVLWALELSEAVGGDVVDVAPGPNDGGPILPTLEFRGDLTRRNDRRENES